MKKIFTLLIIVSSLYAFSCTPSKHRIYTEHTHIENPDLSATEIFHREFDTTRRVLQIFENAALCLEEEKPFSEDAFNEVIDVIDNYIHKRHVQKEDKVLFLFLKDVRGSEKKDFLGQLLMEHVSARDKIRDIAENINYLSLGKKQKKKIIKAVRSYVRFMDKHIRTEEKVLFPWINKVLAADEQMILTRKFEAVEREDIAAGVHEKYTAIIEKLENQSELCNE